MGYTYTSIDGQRVEASTVAPNFQAMAAEFRRVFGMSLHVRSGTRTWDEQYRLWDGYRRGLPGYSLALHPDNPLAHHVETNPNGSRALDLYDSGSDPGVTRVGTQRNNWIRDNCPRWGFTLSGLTFSPQEGWHIHYTGTIGGGGAPAGGANWPARERYGEDWVKAAQNKLNRLGFNVGEEDGKDGPNTQRGTRELQAVGGLEQDGIFGPQTNELADLILAGRNASSKTVAEVQAVVGAAQDNEWGPLTSLATYKWQKANGLVPDAVFGPASEAKAFPAPEQPQVELGRNATSRPTVEVQRKLIELNFLAAGEDDGDYGLKTTAAVKAFQTANWVDADGVYGNTSDGLLFPPAGSLHGADYSFARPGAATLKTRGIEFVGRYLWREKYDDGRTNKGIGRTELDELSAAGIEVFFIYEEDGKELQGGFDAGVRVAKQAESYLHELGLEGRPIYFNVDYDAPADHMPKILEALDGVASVIGRERTGLYAGYGPLTVAFDAGKITWGFQTYAWSGGKWDTRAQLQQWSNGQWNGSIDFTRAMFAEFGQNPVVKPDPEPEPEETVPVPKSKLEEFYNWLKGLLGK